MIPTPHHLLQQKPTQKSNNASWATPKKNPEKLLNDYEKRMIDYDIQLTSIALQECLELADSEVSPFSRKQHDEIKSLAIPYTSLIYNYYKNQDADSDYLAIMSDYVSFFKKATGYVIHNALSFERTASTIALFYMVRCSITISTEAYLAMEKGGYDKDKLKTNIKLRNFLQCISGQLLSCIKTGKYFKYHSILGKSERVLELTETPFPIFDTTAHDKLFANVLKFNYPEFEKVLKSRSIYHTVFKDPSLKPKRRKIEDVVAKKSTEVMKKEVPDTCVKRSDTYERKLKFAIKKGYSNIAQAINDMGATEFKNKFKEYEKTNK